jgi:hypothetical protein
MKPFVVIGLTYHRSDQSSGRPACKAFGQIGREVDQPPDGATLCRHQACFGEPDVPEPSPGLVQRVVQFLDGSG